MIPAYVKRRNSNVVPGNQKALGTLWVMMPTASPWEMCHWASLAPGIVAFLQLSSFIRIYMVWFYQDPATNSIRCLISRASFIFIILYKICLKRRTWKVVFYDKCLDLGRGRSCVLRVTELVTWKEEIIHSDASQFLHFTDKEFKIQKSCKSFVQNDS